MLPISIGYYPQFEFYQHTFVTEPKFVAEHNRISYKFRIRYKSLLVTTYFEKSYFLNMPNMVEPLPLIAA